MLVVLEQHHPHRAFVPLLLNTAAAGSPGRRLRLRQVLQGVQTATLTDKLVAQLLHDPIGRQEQSGHLIWEEELPHRAIKETSRCSRNLQKEQCISWLV